MHKFLLVSATLQVVFGAHNILDYGAIPDISDAKTAFDNAEAFRQAIVAANASTTDREVLIPAGNKFVMMPTVADYISDLTFTLEGTVILSGDFKLWPNRTEIECWDFWTIRDSQNLHFKGKGKIDGAGYMWWWREFFVKNPAGRPHMLRMQRVRNVIIEETKWINSPMYHLYLTDIDSFLIQNMEIFVDIFKQEELLASNGHFDYKLGIPTFPLNTDGIDPSGTNVTIRNVVITNFDDAVAVKPADRGNSIAACAKDILVENVLVYFSVGMTIGSVPPNENYTCIQDVTFRNITMILPIKAIYVKTNPGDHGNGIIANILYEDMQVHYPIWWGIYIGPQQQKQPNGTGPGCMLYPLTPCETQPRVTVRNITLRNIDFKGSVLSPGIIRCNETNPCYDFTFENVHMDAWYTERGIGFITENVYGTVVNSQPDPGFLTQESSKKKNEEEIIQ